MGEVEEDTGEGGELRDEGIFSLSPTEEAAVEARETAAFSSGQRTPCSSLYWPRPELLGGGGIFDAAERNLCREQLPEVSDTRQPEPSQDFQRSLVGGSGVATIHMKIAICTSNFIQRWKEALKILLPSSVWRLRRMVAILGSTWGSESSVFLGRRRVRVPPSVRDLLLGVERFSWSSSTLSRT
jgi:hypothetical protein